MQTKSVLFSSRSPEPALFNGEVGSCCESESEVQTAWLVHLF